jgi:hypothetical protein
MTDDNGQSAPTATLAPPALMSRGSRALAGLGRTRSLVGIVVLLVVIVAGVATFLSTRHGGASTDGSFATGDCVVLTSSAVRKADCGIAHDGRITAVLHQSYDTCPSGSDEFDVTDNTGNLCVDKAQSSH